MRARLPHLPFPDRSFEVVLCGHLLFVYQQQFDFGWHVTACRELVRVARDEVRIHPICGLDGKTYPRLGELRACLQNEGIRSEIVAIDYEFFIGGSSILKLVNRK